MVAQDLPVGLITFLFSDIESSTLLWERHGEQMRTAQARHDALLRAAVADYEGVVVKTTGDGLHAAFHTATSAVSAALSAQRRLQADTWPEISPDVIRVRIGLHSGEAQWQDGDYYGTAVNRAARIMALGHGGQILFSAATATLLQDALSSATNLRDLGEHPLRGLQREEHIYQLIAPDLRVDFPPLKSGRATAGNLPSHLSSFIGRSRELAEARSALSQTRLLTLTGPGGTGKTRLSLQLAAGVQNEYKHGAWLVELAPIADAHLVPDTVAASLGLRESADHPILALLLDYLGDKQCLLILDNCEHLILEVAQFVQTILQRCPDVKILASSREALAVSGEQPFDVPPLLIPDNNQPAVWERWQQYDAMRLLVERTKIVLPEFQVTPDNIAALVRICQRLDGIPLALELAAARMKVLTAAQIAARLDDRFRLLTGGRRTALPHQHTLRASIDWSWELLTDSEQLLLQRLSVFAGGMLLEDVEAICAGDGLHASEVLDLLNELINKSLVSAQRQQGQETRYRLLETIRQYAQEKLAAVGQEGKFRQNHLAYFRQLAAKLEPVLMHTKQGVWLNRLEKELDNIRAALLWALETDIEAGLLLISALSWFCWARGYWHEMETRLAQLLSRSTSLDSHVMAKALFAQGFFNVILFQREQALVLLEDSLILFREGEDPSGTASALRLVGYVLCERGESEKGLALMEESLALLRPLEKKGEIAETLTLLGEQKIGTNPQEAKTCFQEGERLLREVGHWGMLSWTLGKSGVLAMEYGDYETAQSLFEESLTLQESLDLRERAYTLIYLGKLYYRLGDYPLAKGTLEKVLALNRQTEFHGSSLLALVELGFVCLRLGELAQAKRNFIKSLRQFTTLSNSWGMIYSSEGLASLAVNQKQAKKAVRLFAWSDALRQKINAPRSPIEQADVERDFAVIRGIIGEVAYDAAYAEGQVMTTKQAIAFAIE